MQFERDTQPFNQVILYDAHSQSWLRFHRPLNFLNAQSLVEVLPLLETLQTQVQQHHRYAAGFVSYEASPAFDAALQVHPDQRFPLAWFGLYEAVETLTFPSISELPAIQPLDWQASISQTEYEQALTKIKAYIQRGETYQVNFSFRLQAAFTQDPWAYFVRMVQAQPWVYSAWIDTPDWTICSSSPELFFQQTGQNLGGRPMKGTAPRALTYQQDQQAALELQTSEKNRAENLMIVDMVRNDLARVAKLGTVHVPHLFAVEQYPTLWQMTSDVWCQTEANLSEIFQALFPPASITGAPKARTMQIITELESTPRRIYTGTIGFILPHQTADFRSQFNVAIRTVLIDKRNQQAEYGIGSGVVWDSQIAEEFNECYTKARVLTEVPIEFSLLETLLWLPNQGYFLLDFHLTRLQESAIYFAFKLDRDHIQQELQRLALTLPASTHKVRLLLSRQGKIACEVSPISLNVEHPVRVQLAQKPIDSTNVFLYHKTTHRQIYEQFKQEHPQADDVLLWNEKGELTESCIANLVVELDGNWYTPPVECGLLAGTFRRWLLEQGKVKERIIRVEELSQCSRVFLVNSVRQQQEVK